MTNVVGRLLSTVQGAPAGGSVSLGFHTPWVAGLRGFGIITDRMGPDTHKGNIPLYTQQITGFEMPGHGTDIFNRIIVTERLHEVGFLLSTTLWNVELWSTFKRLPRSLTGYSITGTGGLLVTGPASMVYYPWQSQIYTAELDTAGDITIDTTVTWTFTGVTGATLHVIGSRVVVFPHRPDWSDTWSETISYMTSVLPSYNGTEQRVALRGTPRYTASYQVLSTSPLETGSMENTIYGRQAKLLGVPWWPESEPLMADVAAGGVVLQVDMTNRLSFVIGGMVLIWSDFATWEAFNIIDIVGTDITIGAPTTRNWKAGTRVIPMRLGRFEDQALSRPTNWVSSGKFSFLCEAI